jgi:hypothetical protein
MLHRLASGYDPSKELTGDICLWVERIVDEFCQHESVYGPNIRLFFDVLKRMLLPDFGQQAEQTYRELPIELERPYYCLTVDHLSSLRKQALASEQTARQTAEALRTEAGKIENRSRELLLQLETRFEKKLEILRAEFEERIIHMSGKYHQLQSEKKNLELCFDQKFKQCKDLESEHRELGNKIA